MVLDDVQGCLPRQTTSHCYTHGSGPESFTRRRAVQVPWHDTLPGIGLRLDNLQFLSSCRDVEHVYDLVEGADVRAAGYGGVQVLRPGAVQLVVGCLLHPGKLAFSRKHWCRFSLSSLVKENILRLRLWDRINWKHQIVSLSSLPVSAVTGFSSTTEPCHRKQLFLPFIL